jgi:hypothetical protein
MAENSSSGATLPIAGVLGAVAPQTRWSPTIGPPTQDLPGVRHNAITLGPMAAHIALSWIQDHFGSTRRSFKTYHHFCFAEKNGQWPIMSEGSATLRVVAMERLGGRVRGGGSAVSG